MYKKIYIPIDNSDLSDKVLDEGIKLCENLNAELRVVHIIDLAHVTYGIEVIGLSEVKEALIKVATKLKSHILKKLQKTNLHYTVELIETYDLNVADLIIDDSNKWNADLLILGTHKLGSLTHIVSGGVIENISHLYNKPILLINKLKSK